jgi:hypothetical protein
MGETADVSYKSMYNKSEGPESSETRLAQKLASTKRVCFNSA